MVVEGYPNVLITLFTDLIALYNVSATMICSLVYLILLHDGVFVSRFLSAPPRQEIATGRDFALPVAISSIIVASIR